MQNDAKLGLLAGVLGVIVAAVLSTHRPAPQTGTTIPEAAQTVAPKTAAKATAEVKPKPDAIAIAEPGPAVLPTDLPSTPVVRTRKEPDATPASRTTRNNDDIDP